MICESPFAVPDTLLSITSHEARTAIDTLVPAVEGIRASSQDLSRRLAALEHTAAPMLDMSEGYDVSIQEKEKDSHAAATTGGSQIQVHGRREAMDASDRIPPPSDLDLLLQCSRPYSRLRPGPQKPSPSSISTHTGLETIMTGVSLSTISNLSLVSLPISIHEIWNSHHYTNTSDTSALNQYQSSLINGPIARSTPSRISQTSKSLSLSEISVNCDSNTPESSKATSTPLLELERRLATSKPLRKIVFHGMLGADPSDQ